MVFQYEYDTLIHRLQTKVLNKHYDFFCNLNLDDASTEVMQFVFQVLSTELQELKHHTLSNDWLKFFRVVSFLNISEFLVDAMLRLVWFDAIDIDNLRSQCDVRQNHLEVLLKFRSVKWSTGLENNTDYGKHWIISEKHNNKCIKCGIYVLSKVSCQLWWVKHCSFCDKFIQDLCSTHECINCGKEYLRYLLRNSQI